MASTDLVDDLTNLSSDPLQVGTAVSTVAVNSIRPANQRRVGVPTSDSGLILGRRLSEAARLSGSDHRSSSSSPFDSPSLPSSWRQLRSVDGPNFDAVGSLRADFWKAVHGLNPAHADNSEGDPASVARSEHRIRPQVRRIVSPRVVW